MRMTESQSLHFSLYYLYLKYEINVLRVKFDLYILKSHHTSETLALVELRSLHVILVLSFVWNVWNLVFWFSQFTFQTDSFLTFLQYIVCVMWCVCVVLRMRECTVQYSSTITYFNRFILTVHVQIDHAGQMLCVSVLLSLSEHEVMIQHNCLWTVVHV